MTLYGSDAAHRRALLLSEVAAEGASGLSRVLRRATSGDEVAAGLTVSALVRSVRPLTAMDTHEFLRRAHIRESDLAGDITPGQRVALVSLVDRYSHLFPRTR
ncbi:hypothetical protein SAMN05216223_10538 [Actinacidiphila yanglinensis]|uniref:Uncharacterized protein n=1 Tax=Actinacidiphila yanglinensis TaxID=310779 RepID=A0A1H5ZYZ5_9ACTN|nr:hypothetical protein [Actinacidiphila yanglinensis]SEG41194.1 hypothetical protein SAMN05216223_10538 [Actinacidiphila yanglinensis]